MSWMMNQKEFDQIVQALQLLYKEKLVKENQLHSLGYDESKNSRKRTRNQYDNNADHIYRTQNNNDDTYEVHASKKNYQEDDAAFTSKVQIDPLWKHIIHDLTSSVGNILRPISLDDEGILADFDTMRINLESFQLQTEVTRVHNDQYWSKVYAYRKFLISEAYGPSIRLATIECYQRLLNICKGWFDALKRIATKWIKTDIHAIALIHTIRDKKLLNVEVIQEDCSPGQYDYSSCIIINGETFGHSIAANKKEARDNAAKITIEYFLSIVNELSSKGFQFKNSSIFQDYVNPRKKKKRIN